MGSLVYDFLIFFLCIFLYFKFIYNKIKELTYENIKTDIRYIISKVWRFILIKISKISKLLSDIR